jgi:diguanylate cyclase (GGDEF)-like protein
VIEYLNRQPKTLLAGLGVLLVAFVGIFDYISDPEIGFSIFYLLPISLATWFVGIRTGLLISFMCAATWLSIDFIKAGEHSHIFVPYWNSFMRLGFFVVIALLQNALKTEQLQARVDPLTEVANRRHFFEVAHAELERCRRYNRHFTVAYLDLDNFKTVNDTLGHKTGDALLKAVSATIKNNTRSTDTVARLGGDEFALILPETEAEAARFFFDKLNGQLLDVMKERKWPVTFSIGIATFMTPPNSTDDMISQVDALMYSAKKGGKNLIVQEVSD